MRPILFEIPLPNGSIPIHGYGLMIGLAFVAFYQVIRFEARRRGLERLERGALGVLLWMVAALYVGGKALYFITADGAKASLDPGEGFVFYGTLLGGLPMLIWRARVLRIEVFELMDILAMSTTLAHVFGRVGCFLAGCCHGHRCEESWAVTFEDAGTSGLNGVALHPVQLYEAAGLAVLFLVLRFVVVPRQRRYGVVAFAYFFGYAILRTVTESFRGDPGRRFVFGGEAVGPGDPPSGISTSVFLSMVAVVVTAAIYLWFRKTGRLPHVRES